MPINILLVDDKPENLMALEEVLRADDRALFRAPSGNDALRLMLKHDFALVLLDVEMPGMDGYETAQLMRSTQRTKLVPIIFVTAGDRSEERTFRGYDSGAVDFLYKPLNVHTLACKVDVFVELYRKTRDLARANDALARASSTLRERVVDLEHVNQTLSHDLRAPLRSVLRFSEVLSEELSGKGRIDDAAREHLTRVMRAGKRMEAMLDDLYRVLQVTADQGERADIDTSAMLGEVIESLRGDLDAAGATVTHDALPVVRTHGTLLAQVLQNLIANAVKFRSEAPPQVHISALGQPEAWRFAVRDNGVGIPAADQQRVFQLFVRGETQTAVSGTGVGLTLSKRAIEKLGGTIWLESQPGAGTTFFFTIPRDR